MVNRPEGLSRLAVRAREYAALGQTLYLEGSHGPEVLRRLLADDDFWIGWEAFRERATIQDQDFRRRDFIGAETGLLVGVGILPEETARAIAEFTMAAVEPPVHPNELPPAEVVRAQVQRLLDETQRLNPVAVDGITALADAGLVSLGAAVATANAAGFLAAPGLEPGMALKSVGGGFKAMTRGLARYRPW